MSDDVYSNHPKLYVFKGMVKKSVVSGMGICATMPNELFK